jgi:hypothetical protein
LGPAPAGQEDKIDCAMPLPTTKPNKNASPLIMGDFNYRDID